MQSLRLTTGLILVIAFSFFVFHDHPKLLASSGVVFLQQQFGHLITKAGLQEGREAGLTIVGDVMLGRDVEKKINLYGLTYPFKQIKDELNTTVVLGNFEAAVPRVHIPTPALSMVLSVDKQNLESLSRSGFTHLSLANNHSYDYKAPGLANTKEALALYGFKFFGEPNSISSTSVAYMDVNGVAVAVIALNATSGYPKSAEWRPVAQEAERGSDMQIVYIHWGDEYEEKHNSAQKELARDLVDAGVDLVIGHHPHVVQDIESYKGALIFYSLGNFVFDQYFSSEVQIGLMLRLTLQNNTGKIDLIPTDSRDSKASPRVMSLIGKEEFLNELSLKSSSSLEKDIKKGLLAFNF